MRVEDADGSQVIHKGTGSIDLLAEAVGGSGFDFRMEVGFSPREDVRAKKFH